MFMYPGPEYPSFGYETEIKLTKKSPVGEILGKLKKNIKKVAIGGVVLIVLVWFLFLAPKPATLRLNVVEMDSETGIDAEVSVLSGGKMVASGSATEGIVRLEKIPPGDVTIQITPNEGYKETSKAMKLESGEEKTASIEVPLDLSLEMPSQTNMSVGVGCSSNFNLEVRNTMSKAANVSFVSEGDIAEWISVEGGSVEAKSVKSFILKIAIPASYELGDSSEEKTGAVRIKGSDLRMDASIVIVAGGELEVREEELSLDAKQGEKLQEKVGLSNGGVGKITDIRVSASGEIADWMKVSIGKSTLEEDEDTDVSISIAVPINATEGKHDGKVKVMSGCGEADINVDVEVTALEVALETEPSEISSTLYAGSSESVSLRVANPSEIAVNATLSLRGDITDWITLDDGTINIKAVGSTLVSANIEPPYDLKPGTYSGRIEISYMGKTTNVPVVVTVIGEGSTG